jgi:cyclopropane fatty-acyl-phospholipid synthase-like methyltransferase
MKQDKFSMRKQKKFAEMTIDKDVLELGGGAGEFVSLCKPIAKSIISIDKEPNSKDVIKKDIIKFFKENKKKFDVIYARHIIEHFNPDDVAFIFEKSFNFLRQNGILILIFPNLKNLNVATYEFWNDLTHKRPYTPSVLSELLEKTGFKIIKNQEDLDSWDNFILKRILRKIRCLITGFPFEAPDCFIIAKK